MLEAAASSSLFPLRIELVFKEILHATFILSWICSVCSKSAYSAELKKHESLQRKPSVLEAATHSKLFPVRTELVFESNTSAT
jgi:hypothetical protein